MNPCRCAIILLAACLLLVVCKEEGADTAGKPPVQGQGDPLQPSGPGTAFDSLLSVVRALQDSVFADPGNASLTARLRSVSFDSSAGGFYSVGKATYSPQLPAGAQKDARERASMYVGERWALYQKAWHTGSSVRFGSQIAGQISYSKVCAQTEEKDTLYRLILVPLGSVVVD